MLTVVDAHIVPHSFGHVILCALVQVYNNNPVCTLLAVHMWFVYNIMYGSIPEQPLGWLPLGLRLLT